VSARTLTARAWHRRAARIQEALLRLEHEVMDAERQATRLRPTGGPPRLVAFGQYVTQVPSGRGQHGIYGSAAGLEILASLAQPPGDPGRWRRLLLGDLLYLQDRLFPEEGDPPAQQYTLVLRQAQVIRALASAERAFKDAVSPVLVQRGLADRSGAAPQAPDEADAYATEIVQSDHLRHGVSLGPFVAHMVEALGRSSETHLKVDVSDAVRQGADLIAGYRFAADSDDTPVRGSHWAFHQAAVLTCLIRASWAKLIDDATLRSLWSGRDTDALFAWSTEILRDEGNAEARVAMFAGWALLHLDPRSFRAIGRDRPPLRHLHVAPPDGWYAGAGVAREWGLNTEQRDRLQSCLLDATRSALGDPVRQFDLHVPYFYALDKHERVVWRQEHFVVATVPLMLALTARCDDRLLFDKRLLTLVDAILHSFKSAPSRVVTGQGSDANGTVNMVYLHEALAEIHDACERLAAERWLVRFYTRVRRPFPAAADALRAHGVKMASSFLTGLAVAFAVRALT
jgi:hypothetical protein